jgi:glycosyltransferase involved in cell wall biosynthesis
MEKMSSKPIKQIIEVSIIIPVYNEEKDISNCIKSLKKQTFKNFELIIVDDGSTDNTLEIAKQAAKKEGLDLRIIKQNHRGPGEARNLGAKNARGKILVLIDADMTFDKNYIKNLIEPILKNKEVIGTTHDYEVSTNLDNKWSSLWGKIRVSKEDLKKINVFRAIRKDRFLKMGGFDSKYGYSDDQTFWFKYKIKPTIAKGTTCYHKNPETLKGTYKQAKWIGTSWKERFLIFKYPLIGHLFALLLFVVIPFLIILKSISKKLKSEYSFNDLVKFNTSKLMGYSAGVFTAVFLNNYTK